MSKKRKPIPPPMNLPQSTPLEERYMIPFVLADCPRAMLNFLALNSNLPDRYRDLIGQWLVEYNQQLHDFIVGRYGTEAAVGADQMAKAIYAEFLEGARGAREEADREMFDRLDEELFKDFGSDDGFSQ